MNYTEASGYLKKAAEMGSKPGLSRITELLRLMGDPQDKMRFVHVAGTNGKGSFGAMLCSVLKSAGYRVGSFSSPAITDVTDSFRIDCEEVTQEEFGELIGDIAGYCEKMEDKPTEFEILTAAAFEFFVRRECDIAVVECGMGGRLDSTNVIKAPLLSVITNVSRDHEAFLGASAEEIAYHKAGIIKKGCPVYFGGSSDGEAFEVIAGAAAKSSAELFAPDRSQIKAEPGCGIDGTDFIYKGVKMHIPLCGAYQLDNVQNVLECIEILRNAGLDIPEEAVCRGLAQVKWHGRFEVLRKSPVVIFDGAHNPDGISRAAQSIKQYFGDKKVALLIGVMADKEYGLYGDMLAGSVARAFAVAPAVPRALSSDTLAVSLSERGIPACAFSDLAEGVRAAYEYAVQRDIPLIAIGSLYMYREFTEALSEIS